MSTEDFTLYKDRTEVCLDPPFHFPAGEMHVMQKFDVGVYTCVIRSTDPAAYMRAAMIRDALPPNSGFRLVVPYLPAARSDRGYPAGGRIYARLINLVGASEVHCFDPHSPAMPHWISRCTVHEPTAAIAAAFAGRRIVGVIAPDAGAVSRAALAAGVLGVRLYRAGKHRDFSTGKLSGFFCEPLPDHGMLLVVDDICDGGGTFRGLADAIGVPSTRLALWVSHGVFSGAADTLRNFYSIIATTDSVRSQSLNADFTLPVLDFMPGAI